MVIFIILSACSGAKIIKDMSELCSKQDYSHPKLFYQLPEKTEMSLSCEQTFKDGRPLGKGSFGEVRKVTYTPPGKPAMRVAMKKMAPKDFWEKNQILTEISALNAVANSKYSPRLYGCSTSAQGHVYLIQSFLDYDLDNTAFRSKIATLTCAESLVLYRMMFAGLLDLWENGFVHNDIKPGNMMAAEKNTRVFLIDFGLAQLNTDYNKGMGTPIFMPPSKFSGVGRVSQKDDMYSVSLSIAVLEAPRSYDDVFKVYARNYKGACFEKHNDAICREALIKNVVPIFQKAGYGSVQTKYTKDTINFTTLMRDMIEYDHFSYSYVEVLAIIDRLINDDPTVKAAKARDEEAARMKKELEEAEQLKQHMKNGRQRERDIKNEVDLVGKDEVNLIAANIVAGKPDALKERLAAMEQKKKENEAKLAQIQVIDELQRGQLKKIEYKAREGSEVYNNNKDLFKRKPVAVDNGQAEQPEIKEQVPKVQPTPKNEFVVENLHQPYNAPANKDYRQPAKYQPEANPVLARFQPDVNAVGAKKQPEYNPVLGKKHTLGAQQKEPVQRHEDYADVERKRQQQRLAELEAKMVKNKRGLYPYFIGITEFVKAGRITYDQIDWEDKTYNKQRALI